MYPAPDASLREGNMRASIAAAEQRLQGMGYDSLRGAIVSMYEDGKSRYAIARLIGVSEAAVRYNLKQSGVAAHEAFANCERCRHLAACRQIVRAWDETPVRCERA